MEKVGIDLEVSFNPDRDNLPRIQGDKDRISQVFSNLIDYALKSTPPGGQIAIATRVNEDWLEVRVLDTGPGIPPAELERIFDRFNQLDQSRGGGPNKYSGVGLAIAREIVLSHGGSISAHNRTEYSNLQSEIPELHASETGSLFLVRLPTMQPDRNVIRRHQEKPFNQASSES